MTKEEIGKLSKEIKDLSNNFEDEPWTENLKLLKNDFDINSINTPDHYYNIIDELGEILRQTRVLFLYSVLNIVCKESGKLYCFDTPYLRFDAVMRNEGSFYLRDEDGDFSEILPSEKFIRFIDDQYWELYEQK